MVNKYFLYFFFFNKCIIIKQGFNNIVVIKYFDYLVTFKFTQLGNQYLANNNILIFWWYNYIIKQVLFFFFLPEN